VGGLLAAHAQRHGGDRDVLVAARGALLSLATDLEGHPDNAAASLLGGFVVAAGGHALRVPVAMEVAVVAWVPSHSTSTDVSRHRLGENVSRADAVFNIGRSALLVAALATGDVDVLRAATQDRLHQPVRLAAAPRSAEAMEAALAAGAWCAWLSGSGPTVVALCAPDDAAQLSEALPMGAQVKVLHIDLDGAVLNAG
jgi:homoserine kinase